MKMGTIYACSHFVTYTIGFSAVLALFMDVDHYRAVGWFNFGLGVLAILLLFLTFHGESRWEGTSREKMARQWKSGSKCINRTNLSTLFVSSIIASFVVLTRDHFLDNKTDPRILVAVYWSGEV